MIKVGEETKMETQEKIRSHMRTDVITNHGYDPAYERAINRLIGLAEKNTKARLKNYPQNIELREDLLRGEARDKKWYFETEIFHEEMNRLTRESGLRNL